MPNHKEIINNIFDKEKNPDIFEFLKNFLIYSLDSKVSMNELKESMLDNYDIKDKPVFEKLYNYSSYTKNEKDIQELIFKYAYKATIYGEGLSFRSINMFGGEKIIIDNLKKQLKKSGKDVDVAEGFVKYILHNNSKVTPVGRNLMSRILKNDKIHPSILNEISSGNFSDYIKDNRRDKSEKTVEKILSAYRKYGLEVDYDDIKKSKFSSDLIDKLDYNKDSYRSVRLSVAKEYLDAYKIPYSIELNEKYMVEDLYERLSAENMQNISKIPALDCERTIREYIEKGGYERAKEVYLSGGDESEYKKFADELGKFFNKNNKNVDRSPEAIINKAIKNYLEKNNGWQYYNEVLDSISKTDNKNDLYVIEKLRNHPTQSNISRFLEPLAFKHLVEVKYNKEKFGKVETEKVDVEKIAKKEVAKVVKDSKKTNLKRINVGYIQVKEDLDWDDIFKSSKSIGGKVRKDTKLYKNSDGKGLLLPVEDYKFAFKMFSEDPINRGYVESIRFQICEINKKALNLKSKELKVLGEKVLKELAKKLKGKYTNY